MYRNLTIALILATSLVGTTTALTASPHDAVVQDEKPDEEKTPTPASDEKEAEPQEEAKHWPQPFVEGMTETKSGLRYKVLEAGVGGKRPGLGAVCRVKWSAWTPDGEVFDSWKIGGKAIEVEVGTTMPGWNEALQLMTPGMKMLVHIPWKLAYGERGRQHIRGKTDIAVEFHLIRFEPGPELPPFTPLDPEKTTRLASGVKYQVVEKGEGDVARANVDQVVVFADAYTADGELFLSTVVNRRIRRMGSPEDLGPVLGKDLRHLIRERAVILAEIPASKIGGARRMGSLESSDTSIWRFRVRQVVRREPPKTEPMELAGGIKCWVLREGTGRQVTRKSNVRTMEATWIKNGGCIHSSFESGGPIDYGLKMISKGKRKALLSMREGAKCYFELPYELVKDAPGMSRLARGTRIVHYIELRSFR